jgi:hypothetical protein
MLVMIVGIASGEVARRGAAGRSGRRYLAGRISRASSLPSKGGDGGSWISFGSICEFCMIAEKKDGWAKVEVCQQRKDVVEVLPKHTVMTGGVLLLSDSLIMNKRWGGEVLVSWCLVGAVGRVLIEVSSNVSHAGREFQATAAAMARPHHMGSHLRLM